MTDQIWKPNVTVAAVIERAGKFLLVEEHTPDGLRFNQPAGHLDAGESLLHACAREALEETAHAFTPRALVGIYLWPHPAGELTYLRFAFTGDLGEAFPDRALDTGIVRTAWLTADEITAQPQRMRSPLVARCVQDYLAGRRYALDLLHHYG
ncbi:MAG: NUDIX hydrolase [Rhodocyclaceae bacterium]|nr:NUDIX hydrolase [Rhodocyclaceae bacterium]MBX3671286.1 NUDIX hydrolase [Rhodocyclaceae bacterium]